MVESSSQSIHPFANAFIFSGFFTIQNWFVRWRHSIHDKWYTHRDLIPLLI